MAVDKSDVLPLLRENLNRYYEMKSNMHLTTSGVLESTLGDGLEVSASEIDWYSRSAKESILEALAGNAPDVVVCSDCVYQGTSVRPLLEILLEVLLG